MNGANVSHDPALGHVSIHLLVVQGLEDVIVAGTVVMASTAFDEHHAFLHDLAVRTLELHRQSGGCMWGAAAAIGAHPAELSPVGLHAGAARQLELDRLGDFRGTDALFALLRKTKERRDTGYYQGECLPQLMLADFCLYFEDRNF